MEIAKKKDFVEIKYTGYSNGVIFDSNIEEDLKKINPQANAKETVVVVGQGMVVPGFDKALEGKEIGKEYEVTVPFKEGFGDRKRELIKTIPLKIFREKQVEPYPGMVLAMDESLAKVVAVSGARVITDFNNPLAGKDLVYKFKIVRRVDDEKDKAKTLFEFVFRFVPEFEVKDKIVVSGPAFLGAYVKAFNDKFKELIGKEVEFKLKEPEKQEKKAE